MLRILANVRMKMWGGCGGVARSRENILCGDWRGAPFPKIYGKVQFTHSAWSCLNRVLLIVFGPHTSNNLAVVESICPHVTLFGSEGNATLVRI